MRRTGLLPALLILWCDPAMALPRLVGERGEPGNGLGEFWRVAGLAVTQGDTLCVADPFLDRVTLFNGSGRPLLFWGTRGSAPGELHFPAGLQLDSSRHVYIAEAENHRIQRFLLDGTFVQSYGDSGTGPGQFQYPSGILLTAERQLYVADSGNHRVQQIDWSSDTPKFVRSIGDASRLSSPAGVALDSTGCLYVVDLFASSVHKFTPLGAWVKSWGDEGPDPGQFFGPHEALIDGEELHVSDTLNGRIQVFDLDGNLRFEWPQLGLPTPTRLALGPGRRLFVAAPSASRVLVYQLDPVGTQPVSWSQAKGAFR